MNESPNSAGLDIAPSAPAPVRDIGVLERANHRREEVERIRGYLENLIRTSGLDSERSAALIASLNSDLSGYAAGGLNPAALVAVVTMSMKRELGEEKAEEAEEEINEAVSREVAQERAEYAKLNDAAKKRIAARCAHVDVNDPESVFNYYSSYLPDSMPKAAQREIIAVVAKTEESKRHIAEQNALPKTVKEVVATQEEMDKARLARMLKEERFDPLLPEGHILQRISRQNLLGYEGISKMLDDLDSGKFNRYNDQEWMPLEAAETQRKYDFRKRFVDVVSAIKTEDPNQARMCTMMGAGYALDLFRKLEKDTNLMKAVEENFIKLRDQKITYDDLPEDMKQMIASFELCHATGALVSESLFIDRAKALFSIVHTKDNKKCTETARAEITSVYNKLQDASLSEEKRSALLMELVIKYDKTLQSQSATELASFKSASEELVRNGSYIDRVELDILAKGKSEQVAGDVKIDESTFAVFIEDEIKTGLEELKGQRLDINAEKFFGLNGDAAHDAQAIVAKLEKANVKLSAYDENHNGSIDLNELARAMKATMSQDVATVSTALPLVPDATPSKAKSDVIVAQTH